MVDWSARIRHAVDIKIWKELQTLVLSGGKIVICKHHPRLQTQTREMQTVASCVNTFGLVMHEICWNVAFRDLNLQSESTPLLVGSMAASGLRARALRWTLFKICLHFCCCLSWIAVDLLFLILHLCVLMASSIDLGYSSYFKLLYSSYQIQNGLLKHFKCFITWTCVVYHLKCDQQGLRLSSCLQAVKWLFARVNSHLFYSWSRSLTP